jgi:hypothetical protein
VQILIGLVIGIPASIACARLIASQLYEVTAVRLQVEQDQLVA